MMKSEVALLYVLIIMSKGSAQSMKPRRSVFFSDVNLKLFKEPDFDSLSSVLVREDIGQLFIGARGKIIILSLDDITKQTQQFNWIVTSKDKAQCQTKDKSIEECDNYITLMHTLNDGRILVCGTKAFDPICAHLIFEKGKVTMEDNWENGKGKIPFDPNKNFASLVNGNTLYTAGSINFLGSVEAFQRHGRNSLMTEHISSWLKGPNMISMKFAEISKHSYNNEDDSVFLFLTEIGIENQRNDLRLSRVARSDMGGLKTLQRKWTSFLKAHLDCPFGDEGSTSLVQDVFFLQDEKNVSDSIFYATFSLNPKPSSTCSQSAVCTYKLSDIQQVFRGNFMTETDSGPWVRFTGSYTSPYPRTCINDEMRAKGVRTSRDVLDSDLMFVKNHPLMEQVVTPITGKPLLVGSAAQFSRIVVDKVTSLDGQQHNVMFISNNSGWVQKAVWSDDDGGRIIEELQLFQDPQPIRFLQLSSRSGQLYSTTRTAVVQLSVRDCSRYTSCIDCLIARDPYCGWDRRTGLCAAVAGASKFSMIQNLIDGDVGICPSSHLPKQIIDIHLTLDVAQFLPCTPDTNLPISWNFSGSILEPSPRHILFSQGLILTPSFTDEGLYTCDTVEVVEGREHRKAVIQYNVKILEGEILGRVNWFQGVVVYILGSFCLLCVMLIIYMYWKHKP
ncbi:semaphorin-4E-like isoform X2 [Gambusia affinis]|uniref:semaphorin-4E-like isoform X2 n=1 Tax=Gambusia affinis TaxID=33528 RepID=UPI001CDD3B72|nr:semaphorin-4E-like isoform X2 [Gambusia affinis]